MTPVLSTVAAASSRGFGMFGGVFGNLFAWGSNTDGSLGLGDTVTRSNLTSVGTLKTWVSCSVGEDSSYAIKSDGTLWSWGDNILGELGLNDRIDRSSPVQIGIDTNWLSVVAGARHCVALKNNNTLYSWGNNQNGELGIGVAGSFTGERSSPVQITGSWNKVAANTGIRATFAINTSGQLFAWGLNTFGNLGTNDTIQYSSPIQIGSATNWTHVDTTNFHSIGLRGGSIFTWGWNAWGELGINEQAGFDFGVYRSSPVQVGSATNWTHVSAGGANSFAINSSGQLFAWGYNGGGELGLGDLSPRSSPVQIGSDTDWKLVFGFNSFTFGIKTNGDFYAWGSIGLGGVTTATSPIQIGSFTKWKTAAATINASYKLIIK